MARLLEHFTPEHFRQWSSGLVLDSGKPWKIEDFQLSFVADWLSGVPECWLIVPEGNAKTTLVAAIALYHCQFKRWAAANVAASARDQAQVDWDAAEGFIMRSESLEGVFKIHPGLRRIRCLETNSRIQIFAADDRTGDGIIPTLCVTDELHRHRDLKLYRTWRGKLSKRKGQIIAISTSGEPGSEFELTRERIRQEATDVRREETFVRAASARIVLHEWAVPENGNVEDLSLVKRANPLKAITIRSLREVRKTPTITLQHWRRFNCNLPTRSEMAAITESEWFGATVKATIPPGEPIWLGLDVAWKWDTTALVPLWIKDSQYRLLGPAIVLTPPRDGTSLDPNELEAALYRLHERNPLHTVVMDTTKAEQLAEWIHAETGAEVIDRQQTNQFASLDYEKFMEALRMGWLKHTGDPALTRHVLNAIARSLPLGGTRFDRPSQVRRGGDQDSRVIDALTAASMVHTTAAAEFETSKVVAPSFAWV